MDKTFKFKKAIVIALLAIVTTLCGVFAAVSLGGNTKTVQADYTVTGAGTKANPWASCGQTAWMDYNGYTIHISVPPTATVKDDVTTKAKWAASTYNDDWDFATCITDVVFESPCALTKIPDNLFKGYLDFGHLTIPDSVTTIGKHILPNFYRGSLVVPSTVTTIEDGAFSGALNITDITLPANIADINIGEKIFDGVECQNIVFAEGTTSIPDGLFYCAGKIDGEITIPDTVTSIGENAFSSGIFYGSVTIPDSVTSIGGNAFTFSSAYAADLTISKNVTGIASNAFGSDFGEVLILTTNIDSDALTSLISDSYGTVYYNKAGLSEETRSAVDTFIEENVLSSNIGYVTDLSTEDGSLYVLYNTKTGATTCKGDLASEASNVKVVVNDDGTYVARVVTQNDDGTYNITIGGNGSLTDEELYDGLSDEIKNNVRDVIEVVEDVEVKSGSGTSADPWNSKGQTAYVDGTTLYLGIPSTAIVKNDITTKANWQTDDYKGTITAVVFNDGCALTVIPDNAFYNFSKLTSINLPSGLTGIGRRAFFGCSQLTSMTIPDSVTAIGFGAFYGCTALTNINLPSGLTAIEGGMFQGCSALKSITIPGNVTSIGGDAFCDCSSLTGSIIVPNKVTEIGYYAFRNCRGLTNITIPDGVTAIGFGAFSGCSRLTSINIPSGLTAIDSNTFNGCSALTGSITIPGNVTSIGNGAFADCTSLTSVTIGSGVTGIGSDVFSRCDSLESITVNAGNTNYVSQDGILYNKAKTQLLAIPGKISGAITIPGTITSAIGTLFSGKSGLTSINTGNGMTGALTDSTFSGCTSLTGLTIGNGITGSITSAMFEDCTSLTSLTIGNGVTTISTNAFQNNTVLESVTIGSGVTIIANYAFDGCTGLTSVTILEGVKRIASYSFRGCSGLTSITIPDSVTEINSSTFNGCINLESATIGSGLTAIGASQFYGCIKLKSVNIPSGLTAISAAAFVNCSSLTSINIPSGVTVIGYSAFYGCSGLTSITIPDGVTDIGSSTFRDCTSLTSISIPASVTSIGDTAFYGCSNLTSVSIPEGVTSIGINAFRYCTNLTSITIPDSVTTIADSAFRDCPELTRITIGKGVTTIGATEFSSDKNLTEVYLNHTDLSIIDSTSLSNLITNLNTIAKNTDVYVLPTASNISAIKALCDESANVTLVINAIGVSLTISQDFSLSMNCYVEAGSMKFFADEELTEELTATSTKVGGQIKYTLPISPEDIDKEIISIAYDETGEELQRKVYSLKSYLTAVAALSPEYADLTNSVTGYCYGLKNYRGEEVADSDAESIPAEFSETVADTMSLSAANASNRFTGAKVVFDSEFDLKVYFVTNVEDYVVKVKIGDGEEVALNAEIDSDQNNRLCVVVEGIKPYNVNDKIVVKLYINGSATATSTLTYSITDYCTRISGKTENAALKKLVYATYNMYAALRDAIAALTPAG